MQRGFNRVVLGISHAMMKHRNTECHYYGEKVYCLIRDNVMEKIPNSKWHNVMLESQNKNQESY